MGKRMCPCGLPVHYSDPQIEAYVDAQIERAGPLKKVTVPEGTFLVPLDYIALHGFKGYELVGLAAMYGWERVPEKPTGMYGGMGTFS